MKDNDNLRFLIIIAIVLLVCFITGLTGCKTLEVVKEESYKIKSQITESVDQIGVDLTKEIARKVKKEINRKREELPDKIRAEIERTAARAGFNINLRKPLTEEEKYKAKIYVREAMNSQRALMIIKGNVPILEAQNYEDMNANYTRALGYKWIPSKELEAKFFKRSPKAKTARRESQITWMAVYEIKDVLITEAHRSCKRQADLFAKKLTKIKTCTGQHNTKPSNATDFVPMNGKKAMWNNREDFAKVIGLFEAFYCVLARQHGWTAGFRSGSDWKRTGIVQKKGFVDLPHIEIRDDINNDCFTEGL